MVFGHDVGLQVGQIVVFQELHDGVAVGLGHGLPVDVRAQVGHGREHVKGLAALGRHGRIGQGRHVQVEREIFGQSLALENVGQQALVALAENDVVVGQPVRRADTASWCQSR